MTHLRAIATKLVLDEHDREVIRRSAARLEAAIAVLERRTTLPVG